jgi:DNA-binding response OmpR family regulator
MVELAARVRALLRRPTPYQSELLKAGDLELDLKAFVVRRAGQTIELIPKEFALLEFLMRNPNQVFSSEAIMARVWPSDTEASTDVVRSYVTRLRNKLDVDGQPSHIKTVHRMGYKLEV